MKLFIASDVHSYFTEFKNALDDYGYDYNNPDHLLILCGDLFDRGDESQEMLDFINTHTERGILIRGNHDILMQEMIDRGYYMSHDISNGTVKTLMNLADRPYERAWYGIKMNPGDFEEACEIVSNKLQPIYDRMVNYYETDKYIFTHGFLPLGKEIDEENRIENIPIEYQPTVDTYYADWRNANQFMWDEAMWENGIDCGNKGLNQTGKTLVFGHWCASYGHYLDELNKYKDKDDEKMWEIYDKKDEYTWGKLSNHRPYYGDNFIAIDGSTAASGFVNVIVLEDNLLK